MNDLAKYVAHMTAAAEQASALRFSNTSCSQCGREFGPGNSGYSHCKDHDLEQQRAFAEWEREVDAVEPMTMVSIAGRLIPGSDDGVQRRAPIQYNLCEQKGGQAGETANPDDAFTFAPECRELAAHFMPGADAIGIDYLAQALMDCVTEYLAIKEEFSK